MSIRGTCSNLQVKVSSQIYEPSLTKTKLKLLYGLMEVSLMFSKASKKSWRIGFVVNHYDPLMANK